MRVRAWLLTLLIVSSPALASLTADELVLIANKNLPDSIELARHYAKARSVPAANVLELDLPVNEQILPPEYDRRLAEPVRAFLNSPAGARTRCVVLFYGVPLHIRPAESTREQRDELALLRRSIDQLNQRTPQIAQDAETYAMGLGITPRPVAGQGPGTATATAQARVMRVLQQLQAKAPSLDPDRRRQVEQEIAKWQASLEQVAAEAMSPTTQPASGPSSKPIASPAAPEITPDEAQALANKPRDPGARAQLRQFVAAKSGAFVLNQMLEQQVMWISTDETDASVDSELALAMYPDYPRYRWQANPLARPSVRGEPRAIMTCRIDAPTPQLARRIIDESITVEKGGLDGPIVLDSRGIPEKKGNTLDGYGWYDQAIRNAATFIGEKTKLKVLTDDRPQVILPNTHKDVALYIGWYSLQNYVPGSHFAPGAVGYHVASLELTSLRNPLSKEWVPNLLRDGVAATLGAVSEPYLHAFPRPEEFFPLLLTGQYTLAETYWLTVPMTSWKLILIADPLYNPYRAHPGLKFDDLPAAVRASLRNIEASRPDDR